MGLHFRSPATQQMPKHFRRERGKTRKTRGSYKNAPIASQSISQAASERSNQQEIPQLSVTSDLQSKSR